MHKNTITGLEEAVNEQPVNFNSILQTLKNNSGIYGPVAWKGVTLSEKKNSRNSAVATPVSFNRLVR